MPHTLRSTPPLLPTWLFQTTHSSLPPGRLVFKVILLVFSCIAIAYTLSSISALGSRSRWSGAATNDDAHRGLSVSDVSGSANDSYPPGSKAGGEIGKDGGRTWLPSNLPDKLNKVSSSSPSSWRIGPSNDNGSTGSNNSNGNLPVVIPSSDLSGLAPEVIVLPPPSQLGAPPTIGKLTLLSHSSLSSPLTAPALRTHDMHNRLHGYPMFVLRPSVLLDQASSYSSSSSSSSDTGANGEQTKVKRTDIKHPQNWTKHAYLLSVLLSELAKPEAERLQWLMWINAASIVLNKQVPLEIFLPPEGRGDATFEDVNVLVVARNKNATEHEVMMVKVCEWSVEMLSGILSVADYYPEMTNVTSGGEDAAVKFVLSDGRHEKKWVRVPPGWFNALRGADNGTVEPVQVSKGKFMVDFTDMENRDEDMREMLEDVETHVLEWGPPLEATLYSKEARDFWVQKSSETEAAREQLEDMRVEADKLRESVTSRMHDAGGLVSDDEKGYIEKELKNLDLVVHDERTRDHLEAMRKAIEQVKAAVAPLNAITDKASSDLKKEAHETILSAVQLSTSAGHTFRTEEEIQEVEDKMWTLKNAMADSGSDTGRMRNAIKELKEAESKLRDKGHDDSTKSGEGVEQTGKINDAEDRKTGAEAGSNI